MIKKKYPLSHFQNVFPIFEKQFIDFCSKTQT